MLSRDKALAAKDYKTERVAVPEWADAETPAVDAFVMVRGLTATERDAYEKANLIIKRRGRNVDADMAPNPRARLVALTVVDATGKRLFFDEDIELLGAKNAAVIDRIFEVAQRLSGITSEDLEAIEKN